MGLPTEPVILTPEQLAQLNSELSTMRHDINNHLSLIMAAVELIRHKPQMAERMMTTLVEQPPTADAVPSEPVDFPAWNRSWLARTIRRISLPTWILPLARVFARMRVEADVVGQS